MALDLDNFSRRNLERCEESFEPLNDWSYTDWACAAAGEMGEACNLIKKLRRGEDIATEDITDELADVMIYLDLLCQRFGERLSVAVKRKFNKVSKRVGSDVFLDQPF